MLSTIVGTSLRSYYFPSAGMPVRSTFASCFSTRFRNSNVIMAVPMINVGIGKSAFNGCGFEARITTMLSIDKGAMNIPANKRALLRTNKGFISAFVISILLCAESTNLLLTRFGVLVIDFGGLSPDCQVNYRWLDATYPRLYGWRGARDSHLSPVCANGSEPEISPYRWGRSGCGLPLDCLY